MEKLNIYPNQLTHCGSDLSNMASIQNGGAISKLFFEEISHTEIREKIYIGKGSFGVVFKARWKNKDVAIKIFNEKESQAFTIELKQLSRVSHPNIVKLYGASMSYQSVHLVMEFADCGSLYKVLHSMKEVSYNSGHVISWALQCALGVEYLHSFKPDPLIHRDLKSPNLLLFNQGLNLKICDFGTVCDKQTIMTNNKGSAAWMAPEVFKGIKYNEKCDVFSWGIVLWELLTRRLPFEELAGNEYRVLWAINSGKRPPKIADCPEPVWDIIERCWSANADSRPDFTNIVKQMKFIQKFFPCVKDKPIIFPTETLDNETITDNTYNSAVTSPFTGSEVAYPVVGVNNPCGKGTIPSTEEYPENLNVLPTKIKTPDKLSDLRGPHISGPLFNNPKAYYTPPEEEQEYRHTAAIPQLPIIDANSLKHAPDELIRSSNLSKLNELAEDDSGSIPSDLKFVHLEPKDESTSGPSIANLNQTYNKPYAINQMQQYPLSEYVPRSTSHSVPPIIYPPPHSTGNLSLKHSVSFPYQNPSTHSNNPGASSSIGIQEGQIFQRSPSLTSQSDFQQNMPMTNNWMRAFPNPIGTIYHSDVAPNDFLQPYNPNPSFGSYQNSGGSQDLYNPHLIAQDRNYVDSNRLLSVHENPSNVSGPSTTFKKAHRRSSSHGSNQSFRNPNYRDPMGFGAPPSSSQLNDPMEPMQNLSRSFSNLFVGEEQRYHQPPSHYAPFENLYDERAFFHRENCLDNAVSCLEPELRPVPPQPNCVQSMKIYEDHRLLAYDYLNIKKEMAMYSQYKASLQAKLNQNSQQPAQREANQEDIEKLLKLQTEKDALMQFKEQLSTQLQLIKKAKSKQQQQQQNSSKSGSRNDESWVLIQDQQNH